MSELGRLETKKKLGCPSCYQPFSEQTMQGISKAGILRCPNCQQKLRIPEQPAVAAVGDAQELMAYAQPLKCPACSNRLTPITLIADYSLVLDHCEHCGGLWFDYLEVEEVLHDHSLYSQLKFPKPAQTNKTSNVERYCPHCATTKLEKLMLDGVDVDECPTCRGRWLDAGEILELAKFEQLESSPEKPSALWSFFQRFFKR